MGVCFFSPKDKMISSQEMSNISSCAKHIGDLTDVELLRLVKETLGDAKNEQ